MTATQHAAKPLHRRPSAHVGFWLIYVIYRGVVDGAWPLDIENWQVVLLDLPLKVALAYALIGIVAKPLRTRQWRGALVAVVIAGVVAIILRQVLWHGLILPTYQPRLTDHPGFFDVPDLLGNSAFLFPVALVLMFLWVISELSASPPADPESDHEPDHERSRQSDHMTIQIGARAERVRTEDIVHFRSDGDYCRVMLVGKELRVHRPLKDLLAESPPEFIRIHRQYAINPAHLASVAAQRVKVADQWLPVGRTYRESLREALSDV